MIVVQRAARGRCGTLARAAGPVLAAVLVTTGCSRPPTSPAAPEAGPDTAAVRAALDAAERYLSTDELEKAEVILARLVERAPRDADAREMLGQVLVRRAAKLDANGLSDEARVLRSEGHAAYEAAVALQPESAGLRQSAGTIALVAGDEDAALHHFEAAMRLAPNEPQPALFAAQLHLQRSSWPEARAALEHVLRLAPDLPAGHASLAILLIGEGRPEEARAAVATARRLDPADPQLRLIEARVLRETGQVSAALARLTAWTPPAIARAAALGERARCHDVLGDPAAAADAWRDAFEAAPRAADAWRHLVRAAGAYHAAGRADDAWLCLEAARQRAPAGAPEVEDTERRMRQEKGSGTP